MKMMGMSVRSAAMRSCSSRPLRPGSDTSRTRQLGATTRGRARNSCAEASSSGCQPALRISSSRDSRTETSSSTTNTIGVACDMRSYLVSASQCGREGPEQIRLTEWLEQTRYGALFEQAGTDSLVCVRSDEDDRNFLAPQRQFSLEIGSGHSSRHDDVEEQAARLVDAIGHEELLRRRERPRCKAELP